MNNNLITTLCIYEKQYQQTQHNQNIINYNDKNICKKSTKLLVNKTQFVNSYKTRLESDKNLTHYFYSPDYSSNEYDLNNLPSTIIDLTFDIYFNDYIKSYPYNLIRLTFGDNFNKSVDALSNLLFIEMIYFGNEFNYTVEHLPNSLKRLAFSDKFNQSIEFLPKSIQYLTIGIDVINRDFYYICKLFSELIYCQSINDYTTINKNELYVDIGYKCNISLDYLPFAVKKITFNNCEYNTNKFKQILSNLPHSTKQIIGLPNININLPCSLTHLTFGCEFNQTVDNLPCSLTHLIFGYEFNQIVDNLPCSLTHLIFVRNFNQKINNLPKVLEYIEFKYFTNINGLFDNLPDSIKYINLPDLHNIDQIIKKYPNINIISKKNFICLDQI